MDEKSDNHKAERFRFLRMFEQDGPFEGEDYAKSKPRAATALEIAERVWYRIYRLLGELVAIVLGIAFLWFYGLNYLLAQRTVDISFLDMNASLWFSKAFDGHAADVGAMYIRWNAEDSTISLDARDVVVRDKFRAALQDINRLQVATDFDASLKGEIKPRWAKIDGGSVTWKRNAQDRVTVGFGTPNSVDAFGVLLPENARRSGKKPQPFSLGSIATLHARNAIVYVQDANSGIDHKFTNTDFSIEQVDSGYEVASKARFGEEDSESSVAWELAFSPDYEDFNFHLVTDKFNLKDVAPERGRFSSLARANIPLNSEIRVVSEREVGLSKVDVDVSGVEGDVQIGENVSRVEKLSLIANFDAVTETLTFDALNVKAGTNELNGTARLKNIGTPATGFFNQTTQFEIDIPKANIDLTSLFDAPFGLGDIRASGSLERVTRKLDLDELKVGFETYNIITTLNTEFNEGWQPRGLRGEGEVIGSMTASDLIAIWPTEFAMGARRWIERSIKAGTLHDLNFNLDIPEGPLSGQALEDDNLELNFKVRDGTVKYIKTMPPYTGVTGKGTLRGNSFTVQTNTGSVGEMTVTRADVNIPRLSPKGGDFTIDVEGYGAVEPMMALIDNKPFEFASRYGVKPEDFGGAGKIKMTITRPLLEYFDQNRISYAVEGQFEGVKAPFSVGEHALENGYVTLVADKTAMTIKGPVNIGPWEADLLWQETFDFGATPTQYNVSGRVDRDTLDGFGIGLREYIGGTAVLSIDATGDGLMISDAKFSADLAQSDIQIGSYWAKDAGVDGQISGRMSRNANGAVRVDNMQMRAPGLIVDADVSFAEDFKLEAFNISRADIPGFVDAAVSVKPGANDTAFDVAVTGQYLDISPFVSQALTAQTTGVALPVSLTSDLKRLALNEAFILRDTMFTFEHNGSEIQHASISGDTDSGKFAAAIMRGTEASPRIMRIDIPNASDAAFAFFNLDNIKGGRMQVDAQLPPAGELGALMGTVNVENFVLRDAPVLAQMLSLASLRGLTDAMGGAGLNFTELNIPFSYETGLLKVREANAAGPALGMTGSGDIDFKDKIVDVDGVLVPAYSANSALGAIPVIGDIFVGKKGEGIFALNYSVKGPFKQTQVAVNPLSALTPGFLRGIFSSERDGLDPVKRPENEKAKAQQNSEKEETPVTPDE